MEHETVILMPGIGPELQRPEAGHGELGPDPGRAELRRHLGPHLFARVEGHRQPQVADGHDLPAGRAELHLYPLALGVPDRDVLELLDIEVGPQLPVDDLQDVAVELGRDSGRVVVGAQQPAGVFHQVGAEQEHVPAG